MGGVFKAIGKAVKGVVKGIGSVVGGVVKGVGNLFKGKPLKALGSVVGGVVKGAGSVVKGGLGAVKSVLGDPIITGVAGLATGGLLGAAVGPVVGKLGAGIVGTLEKGVGSLFGGNAQPAQAKMKHALNARQFGPSNAYLASVGPGQIYCCYQMGGLHNLGGCAYTGFY